VRARRSSLPMLCSTSAQIAAVASPARHEPRRPAPEQGVNLFDDVLRILFEGVPTCRAPLAYGRPVVEREHRPGVVTAQAFVERAPEPRRRSFGSRVLGVPAMPNGSPAG